MTDLNRSSTIEIPALAVPAYRHFSDVLDFVWKAPEFIEHQRELELSRARRDPGATGTRGRWGDESRKLYQVFPALLANANVFLVASLLELHLQLLLENIAPTGPQRKRGNGGARDTLASLAQTGLPVTQADHWQQIDSFIEIRNCLMHSDGLLQRSRNGRKIVEIVEQRTFLKPEHAQKEPNDSKLVRLVDTGGGNQLLVDNEYAWIGAVYARDYIVELCGGEAIAEVSDSSGPSSAARLRTAKFTR
jgi:hypothetical protein